VPPLPTSAPTLGPDINKRGIAGRIDVDLEKRHRKSTLSILGGCRMAAPSQSPITIPSHPRAAAQILSPDQAGTMDPRFTGISRYMIVLLPMAVSLLQQG